MCVCVCAYLIQVEYKFRILVPYLYIFENHWTETHLCNHTSIFVMSILLTNQQ